MIDLTRLSGSTFVLNSDLIERIEASPDTVITLIDGKKFVVAESVPEVVALVLAHQREVLGTALTPAGPRLAAVRAPKHGGH